MHWIMEDIVSTYSQKQNTASCGLVRQLDAGNGYVLSLVWGNSS